MLETAEILGFVTVATTGVETEAYSAVAIFDVVGEVEEDGSHSVMVGVEDEDEDATSASVSLGVEYL